MKTDAIKDWPVKERPNDAARLRSSPQFQGVPVMCYEMHDCYIIVADEPLGWHLSISHTSRDPTWQEIATARYRLLGGVRDMAMFLPPLDEYVNKHPHCFHLHEHPERAQSRIVIATDLRVA